jgi:hypothetical protein
VTPLHVIARCIEHRDDITYELTLWTSGRVCAETINAITLQPMKSASVMAGPALYEKLAHENPETWIDRVIFAAQFAPLDSQPE